MLSNREREAEEAELRRIREAIALLETYDVRIPYIEQIKFPLEQLADRRRARDFDDLIRFIAYLYQYQRPKLNGKLYALPYDFELARVIAEKVIAVTRGALTDKERELYNTIQDGKVPLKWMTEGWKAKVNEDPEAFKVQDVFELAVYRQYATKTLYRWLNSLARKTSDCG